MWSSQQKPLGVARGFHYSVLREAHPASVLDVLNAWQTDERFGEFFNKLLADAPFGAFRWETPAATSGTLSNLFEFVLVDSPGLDRQPDPKAFAKYFESNDLPIAAFKNLGGDAIMVVPRHLADVSAYGHLASFVRLAPAEQRQLLWQKVGEAMKQRISDKPVWLSTAGAGVSWLHVRLDDRPKYYSYDLYRKKS